MGGSLAGRLAAVALGVVLLVAGIAKRADRRWPQDAAALGTPGWAIPVLPWFEMLLGAVLVSGLAGRSPPRWPAPSCWPSPACSW